MRSKSLDSLEKDWHFDGREYRSRLGKFRTARKNLGKFPKFSPFQWKMPQFFAYLSMFLFDKMTKRKFWHGKKSGHCLKLASVYCLVKSKYQFKSELSIQKLSNCQKKIFEIVKNDENVQKINFQKRKLEFSEF